MSKTARITIRMTPETLAEIRGLWRQTFARHGLSFGDWIARSLLAQE